MSIFPVISQKLYPGVGDIDDCWVVATVWAARGADRCSQKPTIREFRAAAGNPDDPYRADGGNIYQIAQAVPVVWPLAKFTRMVSQDWAYFMGHLDAGDYITVALLSKLLPASMRYGFNGAHQVGLVKTGGRIYLMNPLAPDGSQPQPISETALRTAIRGVANGWIMGGAFKRQPFHPRYGGKRTTPFPDHTRASAPSGRRVNVRTAPSLSAPIASRYTTGTLFTAYQRTDTGASVAGSRRWYGNHRGTRWIHESGLKYAGGAS